MWNESIIQKTIEHVKNLTDNFVVLHCQSTYPAPEDNLNMRYLKTFVNIMATCWIF